MGNKNVRSKLQKEWDNCGGKPGENNIRRIFRLYDRNNDGLLTKPEAMLLLNDLLWISGQENEVLKEKPLFKDEKEHLLEFVDFLVTELVAGGSNSQLLPLEKLLASFENYEKFIMDRMRSWNVAARREEIMIQQRVKEGRKAMMEFELEETMATLEEKAIRAPISPRG